LKSKRTLWSCFLKFKPSDAYSYERAPEPEDICWENLNVSKWERFLLMLKTYFLTLIALGVSFGIIIYISSIQGSDYISYAVGLVIIILNEALAYIIKFLSEKEKHDTITAKNLTVASKQTIFLFINTALVPLLANI
jgi:hypothetical protein